jgi:hypothetical protein
MITKYAPEPGDFTATWHASPDSCPGCQEYDGESWDNPYDVPTAEETCFSMNGVGKGDGECACTIEIDDPRYGGNDIDAVAFDPDEFQASEKSARITNAAKLASWPLEKLIIAQKYLRMQIKEAAPRSHIFTTDDNGFDIDKSIYDRRFSFKTGKVEPIESSEGLEDQAYIDWAVRNKSALLAETDDVSGETIETKSFHTHVRTYNGKHFATMCFADDEDGSVAGVNR